MSPVGFTLGPFLHGRDQQVPRCLHTVFQSDMVTSLSLGTLRARGTTKMISRLCDSTEAMRQYSWMHPSTGGSSWVVPTDTTGSPPASALQTFGTEVYSTGLLILGQPVKGQEYWEAECYHGCILSFCATAQLYWPSAVCWEAPACVIRQKDVSLPPGSSGAGCH